MNFTFPYDREKMILETKKNPEWLHFGAGNIFRAFPCALAEKLLASGEIKTGVIAAEGFDEEIIEKVYKPFDNVSLLVTLCGDGNVKKTPIGSVAEALSVYADYILFAEDLNDSDVLRLVNDRASRIVSYFDGITVRGKIFINVAAAASHHSHSRGYENDSYKHC